jgi:hypothetical protein
MPEFISSLISGTISGIVTGVIVGIYLFRYQKKRDLEERQNLSPYKLKLRLPRNILRYVQPGISLEKTKEYFGVPDHISHNEHGFFMKDTNSLNTNSYLFNFQNASVRITSVDKLIVDTVSIFVFDEERKENEIEVYPIGVYDGGRAILGKSKLTEEIINTVSNHLGHQTNKETIIAIETDLGWMGNYLNFTYFSCFPKGFQEYEATQDPKALTGSTINGFCVSTIPAFAPSISRYQTN